VTKQAASQLIDTLVLRGYLDRAVDPEDRRRMTIMLTGRGRAAAAVRAGIETIDAELSREISPGQLAGLRAGLDALWPIRERAEPQPLLFAICRQAFWLTMQRWKIPAIGA
jgi:hypothetical protein